MLKSLLKYFKQKTIRIKNKMNDLLMVSFFNFDITSLIRNFLVIISENLSFINYKVTLEDHQITLLNLFKL